MSNNIVIPAQAGDFIVGLGTGLALAHQPCDSL